MKQQSDRIALALERIATAIEGLLESTNPLRGIDDTPIDDSIQRVFYTSEENDIVRQKLAKMGKEYKERV